MQKTLADKVWKLDLSMIRGKLISSLGWSEDRAVAAEVGYRKFLVGNATEPTADVDEFWHRHILDTRKYAEDCDTLFGKFLHHVPSYQEDTCDKMCKRATCNKSARTERTCLKRAEI